MTALVLLIGEQSMPNYLSAIRLEPSIIYMLYTNDSKVVEVNNNLTKAIKERLPETVINEVVVEAYNINSTYEVCNNICKSHDAIINITGGTKIMAFGAFRAGIEHNAKLIYVDTRSKRFLDLGNNKIGFFNNDKFPNLTIDDFILLAGSEIIEEQTDFIREYQSFLEPLSIMLVDNYDLWDEHCVWFNSLRRMSLVNSFFEGPIRIKKDKKFYSAQGRILQALQVAGVISNLKITNNNVSFHITPLYVRNNFIFKKGTPLELFAFFRLSKLEIVEDIRIGVKYKWDADDIEEKVNNELDVLVSSNSLLTYISCKSGKVETAALNELKTYADNLGGVFANKIMLGREVMFDNKDFIERAELMRIRTVNISEMEDDNFSLF